MPPEGRIDREGSHGSPHPADRGALFGHGEAQQALAEAIASGRLHHAWLIGGPRGIGKATLAFRVARFLLSGRSPASEGDPLAIPADHPAARQVAAGSHPNLVVLDRSRPPDRKTAPTTISVEAVRRALSLFESTAADRGYRICIVDAADDLTVQAANALLKMIEEPPPKSLFLVVSHAPQRLLATIRSRCRRLTLDALTDDEVAHALRSLGPPFDEPTPEAIARVAGLAEGSVARALALLDPEIIGVVDATTALLSAPRLDWRKVLQLAETVASREADRRFEALLDTAAKFVTEEIRRHRAGPVPHLAALVEVCEKSARAASEAATYNLDRRPLVLSLFGDLAAVTDRGA